MQQPDENHHDDQTVRSKYLIFSLCGELYGVPLLQIREVIKYPAVKEVPGTERYLRGVINLRGQILSVIDLRMKFQLRGFQENQGFVLIIETPRGLMGGVVDTIEYVREIQPDQIDTQVAIETSIPKAQFTGVARSASNLIHIIDLSSTVQTYRQTEGEAVA